MYPQGAKVTRTSSLDGFQGIQSGKPRRRSGHVDVQKFNWEEFGCDVTKREYKQGDVLITGTKN